MASSIQLLAACIVSVLPLALSHLQAPADLDCPIPYRNVGGTCLYFNSLQQGPWHDSESFCQDIGGHLVKIDDANLLYDIVRFINDEQLVQAYYWIGASDEGHEGDWRWTDNSAVKMGTPFWGTLGGDDPEIQEPRGGIISNCAIIARRWLFYIHDSHCSFDYMSGICEYEWQF